jgi:hypothetical protein
MAGHPLSCLIPRTEPCYAKTDKMPQLVFEKLLTRNCNGAMLAQLIPQSKIRKTFDRAEMARMKFPNDL